MTDTCEANGREAGIILYPKGKQHVAFADPFDLVI